jgi:glycine cleavage system H protein
MTDTLEIKVDKFTFKIATDRWYTPEGAWAREENGRVRVGLSDFVQQHSGDIAFAEVWQAGTTVAAGDEVAAIETIKVNISIVSPVAGRIVAINPAIAAAPEAINQDPYGEGWLALLEATDWEADKQRLLDPQAYFEKVKREAEQEIDR